ncbi:MAG: DUF4249 family protein [Bacteroidota bacterium]
MRYIYFTLLLGLIVACEKEQLTTSSAADLPVVTAYLSPGRTVTVDIYRQLPFDAPATAVDRIGGLTPTVEVDGEAYPLSQREDGLYLGPNELEVHSGKTYTLSFSYLGTTVSASTSVPAKPVGFTSSNDRLDLSDFPFSTTDPIELSWDNPALDFHQVAIQYAQTDTVLIDLFSGRAEGGGGMNTLTPQQTNTFQIRPFSVSYSGQHRAVLYRVTTDYAVFAEESSNSSVNLTAPFTNVTNGLGIFTAFAADTLSFRVDD